MSEALAQDKPATRATERSSYAPTWKRFQPFLTPHTPMLVLDGEGTIQHLTPAARRMLEYRADQMVDRCFFTHVHGRNLYQVMRDIADMVCYGKAQTSWLLRLRTGQGRWQWYKAIVRNQLHQTETGAITITLRDLTET